MKIFKFQILAGILSSIDAAELTPAELREANHRFIFGVMSPKENDNVKVLAQIKFPKFWNKWIENKAAQVQKIGDKASQIFERCGQEST